MKRAELKALIKECLVEILQEGVGPLKAKKEEVSETRIAESVSRVPQVQPNIRRILADNTHYGVPAGARSVPAPVAPKAPATPSFVNSITPDPVLSSIFADTYATTFQQQEVEALADNAAYAVAKADPMDLFAGSAANWATLAFSDKK